MEKETWIQRVKEELGRGMGKEYQILSGITKEGIPEFGIRKLGEIFGIMTSLKNSELKTFDDEKDIQPAAIYVRLLYQTKQTILKNAPGPQSSFEEVKANIIFDLNGILSNDAPGSGIPHEFFLDMIKTFKLYYDQDGYQFTRDITNTDMKAWGVGVKELSDAAEKNTPILFPPVIIRVNEAENGTVIKRGVGLEEKINRLRQEKNLYPPMFVLTNESGKRGASCILYEGLLEQIADVWKTDLVILPSSIDETLFFPDQGGNVAEWLDSVIYTNRTEDMEGLKLTDSVYLYDYKEKYMKMVATAQAESLN